MKKRPILFNGEMVRAILCGQKTQTRRIINPQPSGIKGSLTDWSRGLAYSCGDHDPDENKIAIHAEKLSGKVFPFVSESGNVLSPMCPFAACGDQLWVRETWMEAGYGDPGWIFYKASDYVEQVKAYGLDRWLPESEVKWKPSIHMPRAASRITLEITNVRVERLQDISEEDAKAEGSPQHPEWPEKYFSTWRVAYKYLWESINGPRSWDANPWVWVVEFKRI